MNAAQIPPDLRSRIVVTGTGCWQWTAGLDGKGYACHTVKGRSVLGHRYVYEQVVGEIPAGLTLDHLCRNIRCVNPSHLEPVTLVENSRRAAEWRRIRQPEREPRPGSARLGTMCKKGLHLLDENNARIDYAGYVKCAACKATSYAAWRARKRAVVPAV